jgi:hypothetical protein
LKNEFFLAAILMRRTALLALLLLQKEAHLISEPRDNKFTQDYARFF